MPPEQGRITDVPGLRVGHAEDVHVRTGVTVILPDAPVVMAVDVRGGGPGTRETDALNPHCLVERVHGLVLAGGSVFGLAAADAVVQVLSRRGVGLPLAGMHVPVVPAAILFDLNNGGAKDWNVPPYFELGRQAVEAVTLDVATGPVGAGCGAMAGSRRGWIGMASTATPAGYRIGALIAVNSFGEVSGDVALETGAVPLPKLSRLDGIAGGQNTTIGAVATDAPLTRPQAQRLAMMAHDGLARAIRPIHTPFDGDTLFALSTAAPGSVPIDPVELTILGTLAADCVAQAVRQGVSG